MGKGSNVLYTAVQMQDPVKKFGNHSVMLNQHKIDIWEKKSTFIVGKIK